MRARIVAIAKADPRVTGGADIGSAASDSLDQWSDIDITFGVKAECNLQSVLDDWTRMLEDEFGVTHYFDVHRGNAIYRVILFTNCMELDLSVASEKEFGALSPNFHLLFGNAIERSVFPQSSTTDLIGWGWHHILHANSAICRARNWQAEFWISSLRNNLFSLPCIRFGVPSAHGRGIDRLPKDSLAPIEYTLIRSLDRAELRRALNATAAAFIGEVREHDTILAGRLEDTVIAFLNEKQ
ncbi:MAG: nucleotidyltransferase domain-containing protein [Candidatus Kapaibacterium sp.]